MGGSRRVWVVGLCAIALALRVAVVVAGPAYRPTSDPRDYDRYGVAIAQTGSFPRSNFPAGGPTAYRPPAYPYFVGAVYAATRAISLSDLNGASRWTALRVFQAVLGVGVVLLIGFIAHRLWGRAAALIAMALAAVFPPLISLGDTLLSENLLVPLVLGAVAAVLTYRGDRRARWLVLTGVCIGGATLTHPNAIVILPPLAPAVTTRPRRKWRSARPAVVITGVTVLALAPWTVRNLVQMHTLVPLSTEAGPTLAGTYNATAAHQRGFPGNWIEWWRDPAGAAALKHARGREVATDRGLQSAGLRYALHHPGYVATVVARNIQRLLGLAGSRWTSVYAAGASVPRSLIAADFAAVWLLLPLALLGLLTRAARRARVGGLLFLYTVPLLLLVTVVPLVGYERVRAPADPFLLMLASLGIARVFAFTRERLPAERALRGTAPA